jgi:hypothetical protein
MGTGRTGVSRIASVCLTVALVFTSVATRAQEGQPPAAEPHVHAPQSEPQHVHTQQEGSSAAFATREGSGTSWLPDATPMFGPHRQYRSWQLMAHGNAFLQALYDTGARGSGQVGSINWMMGMARRDIGQGRLGFRGMVSLEPWTIAGCGYPDLLATGEACDGETIHDRQHPHDLFMELAAEYDRPLRGAIRWQVYGGLAGEPALGPVAFPHRLSAMPNPLAPIAHHWLDATHITFGVVTAGVYGSKWKAEASSFNGREPDEDRSDLDLAALDSFSGRLWFLPARSVALQISAGRLTEAEPGEDGNPAVDVTRVTGSVTYHRSMASDSLWATTVAWGRNREDDHSTHALLAETSISLREQDTWFGRVEVVEKTAHDLDLDDTADAFVLTKLQAGYVRSFAAWRGMKPGIGGSLSAGIVPASLESSYGDRVNLGVGLFLTIRPIGH